MDYDARFSELMVRMDRVEEDIVKHSEKDERSFKYAHNMMEDALDKLASLERSVSYYEGERVMRGEADKQQLANLKDMDSRLRTVERLSWIAVGGVTVIAGVLYFGLQALLRALH